MHFKKVYLAVFLFTIVLLLSSCEVYQTLSGSNPDKMPMKTESGKVIRIEGKQYKESSMAKMLYSSLEPTQHDPFKVWQNPLGPFTKGKSLGFTLEKWLSASGIGIYTVNGDNAELELSFKNLVPGAVYTMECSRVMLPPEFKIQYIACGNENYSASSFNSDAQGKGAADIKIDKIKDSTKEEISVIMLTYHSDRKIQSQNYTDYGQNSHVQLFFVMPQYPNATSFQIPIKFANHIDSGFPEQDVFIEDEQAANQATNDTISGNVIKESMGKNDNVKNDNVKIKKTVIEPKKQYVEGSNEKPIVVQVEETDLVDLVTKAEDPDKNTSLFFTFTSPLSDKGEWQTTYGDSGEYTVTVTASDGESTTSRDVLVIVKKKEESPTIDSAKPIESGLSMDETQSINFAITASDLNKDALQYAWKLDGVDMGIEPAYSYQSTYDDAGTHTIKVDVSDGTSSTSKIWSVNVGNVNRKPALEKIGDIKAKETDKIVITALATDDDKDTINYSISDNRFVQEDNVFTWQTDYDSAGDYKITISASDGKDTTKQEINLAVVNINRPPVISDILQKK